MINIVCETVGVDAIKLPDVKKQLTLEGLNDEALGSLAVGGFHVEGDHMTLEGLNDEALGSLAVGGFHVEGDHLSDASSTSDKSTITFLKKHLITHYCETDIIYTCMFI